MISFKEEFLTSDKLKRAQRTGGDAAVVLWLVAKGYAAAKGSDGFVPREHLEEHHLVSRRTLKKSIKALLECGDIGPDGQRGEGLLVELEHGYQLHDYLDHSMSADELAERRERERDKKRAQRERSKLRAQLISDAWTQEEADAFVRGLSRDEVRDALEGLIAVPGDRWGTVPGTGRGQSPGTHGDSSPGDGARDLARPQAPARVRAGDPTQPNPTQPNPSGCSDHAREPDEVFIKCPVDLELDEGQKTNLRIAGLSMEFIERGTPLLRAQFVTQNPRTRSQWQSTLSRALNSAWANPERKAEYLGKPSAKRRRGGHGRPIQPNSGESEEELLKRLGFPPEGDRT